MRKEKKDSAIRLGDRVYPTLSLLMRTPEMARSNPEPMEVVEIYRGTKVLRVTNGLIFCFEEVRLVRTNAEEQEVRRDVKATKLSLEFGV